MTDNRATRISLQDGKTLAIIGTQAQLLYIKGVGEDPGGSLIWDWGDRQVSDRFSTEHSRQLYAAQVWNNPLAPKGSVFVRFSLEENAITGYVGEKALISFPTKSQVAKSTAKFAFEIAKACGMSNEAMQPMFDYPKAEVVEEAAPAETKKKKTAKAKE